MRKILIALLFLCPAFAFADTKIIGNSSDTCSATIAGNYFLAQKFTAVATGPVTQIRFKTNGSATANVGIYSDVSGTITTRLTFADSVAVVSGWNNITVPTYTLTSGQNYWLASDSDATVACYDGTNGASNSMGYYARNQNLGMPLTASALTGGVYSDMNLQGWEISTTATSSDVATTTPDTTTKGDLGLIGLILLTFAWYYFIVHLHGKFFPVK